MARFLMLVGLPGSGKSTYAANIAASDRNWIHLSSDRIAENNFAASHSADHQSVFSEMYRQTVQALEAGNNVLYDATNLASQKRKSFLNRIQSHHAETQAVVFLAPYTALKERNHKRSGRDRVPDHVMDRYIRGFQFPKRDENFDRIAVLFEPAIPLLPVHSLRQLAGKPEISFEDLYSFYDSFTETKPVLEFEAFVQQSYEMRLSMQKAVQDPIEREVLTWTALLHNIGKPYVRKNRPLEEDNFYGYEHVSSYLAYPILSALGFSQPFIFDVISLIEEHAEAPSIKRGKLKRRMGLPNYERLQLLLDHLPS
ncbi:AAA family ATPase [Planomicrobium sp. CPCC 101110]|uniref:AAA family ATPase n=1 Tax=Planomicrobium sp. CPCC 101110 TaxID=2599619 RepID=UPI0011B75859|nr:AAA family ATPase [Planomicrobium sp. CPCC 101110]TWT24244.1 AAA family ATPase [Planomicrobium sp. CPCC 101110]